jgi:predicted GH43/DUF377 family glycosyl hydrolase
VPNVVFASGVVPGEAGELLLYYAACDETTCLARCTVEELVGGGESRGVTAEGLWLKGDG